jgi:hypothetical protein
MRGAIPPLPQYVLMAWCLVQHMDNFNFTFNIVRVIKSRRMRWTGIVARMGRRELFIEFWLEARRKKTTRKT